MVPNKEVLASAPGVRRSQLVGVVVSQSSRILDFGLKTIELGLASKQQDTMTRRNRVRKDGRSAPTETDCRACKRRCSRAQDCATINAHGVTSIHVNRADPPAWLLLRDIDCFPSLALLTSLKLTHVHLKAIPSCVASLPNLTHLDLHGNKIASLAGRVCAALTQLQALDLSHNVLGILPVNLGCMTSLASLNLSYNLLPALPHQIKSLHQLHSLQVDCNPLLQHETEISTDHTCALPTLLSLAARAWLADPDSGNSATTCSDFPDEVRDRLWECTACSYCGHTLPVTCTCMVTAEYICCVRVPLQAAYCSRGCAGRHGEQLAASCAAEEERIRLRREKFSRAPLTRGLISTTPAVPS